MRGRGTSQGLHRVVTRRKWPVVVPTHKMFRSQNLPNKAIEEMRMLDSYLYRMLIGVYSSEETTVTLQKFDSLDLKN